MNDLLTTLYEFLSQRRMGQVWDDPEYSTCRSYANLHEKALRARLDPECTQLLEDLLYELSCQHAVELETIFRATLSLSRELGGLVRL